MARSLDSRNAVVLRAIDFANFEGRLEEDVFGHFGERRGAFRSSSTV